MLDYLNDNVITIVAKTLWDRRVDPKNENDWYWDGYASSWQEKQKEYTKGYIENLNIKFLKKWIENGIHSDELIAKTVLLAYDVRNYKVQQKKLINEISDPVLRQSVIDSLKDDF
jgi:hypothetical protein